MHRQLEDKSLETPRFSQINVTDIKQKTNWREIKFVAFYDFLLAYAL